MNIDPQTVISNLEAFSSAYGLESRGQSLVEDILSVNDHIKSVGILLRDPVTKKELISCQFPVTRDCRGEMIWVSIDERQLEAVPIYTRRVGVEYRLRNIWATLRDKMSGEHFHLLEEGDFRLTVHESFAKNGVIERFIPSEGWGLIRRIRKGIFFMKRWCLMERIEEGQEVSFIPIITRNGLQARAIEEVRI